MKEEIKAFKAKNGNTNLSNKEMLMYVVQRIDTMDEKISNGAGKIGNNRTAIVANSNALKSQKNLMTYLFSAAFGFSMFILSMVLHMKGVFG